MNRLMVLHVCMCLCGFVWVYVCVCVYMCFCVCVGVSSVVRACLCGDLCDFEYWRHISL